jgi:hypothetical protein
MTKEVYNRIHDRMNEIRKSPDLAIDVLWDEERALWLAETHWRLRQGGPAHRSVDIIAAEGPTITDALARLGKEIELAASSVPPPSWQG